MQGLKCFFFSVSLHLLLSWLPNCFVTCTLVKVHTHTLAHTT